MPAEGFYYTDTTPIPVSPEDGAWGGTDYLNDDPGENSYVAAPSTYALGMMQVMGEELPIIGSAIMDYEYKGISSAKIVQYWDGSTWVEPDNMALPDFADNGTSFGRDTYEWTFDGVAAQFWRVVSLPSATEQRCYNLEFAGVSI